MDFCMSKKAKSLATDRIEPGMLKQLSTSELQQWLDAFSVRDDSDAQEDQTQLLLRQTQQQQIELEMRNRELQEARHQLEQAQERYAVFYDSAPVCCVIFDAEGSIRNINQAGAALLGYERAYLLGKSFREYLTEASQPVYLHHLDVANQTNQVVSQELQLKLASGEPLDVRLESTTSSELFDGKTSCRSVVIDISSRKYAEQDITHQAEQLRLITDAIPAYIAYVDRHQRYRFANKAYESWFKPSQEKILGKTIKEVVGDETYARIEHYIQQALAGNNVNFDASARHPDGAVVDVNVNYIPDFAGDGSVLGYFVVNQDITEIRQREASDKQHMLEAARISRINTMGEMVAELAHELNQPLGAITIYSDAVSRMLQKGNTDAPEVQKALNEIRFQAERAGEVIRRLREFVSKRELLSEQIQLNTLVQEVINLISVEARWHDTKVRLELGEAIPLVEVDRILIEQVILNLARNAIEAMDAIEQDNRLLIIKTDLVSHEEVELTVADCGPGIDADEIERIFEPFYTSKAHGMGMGLAISRSIIKAHHGRIWAIPNEYGGTMFTFILPRHQEN